MNVPKTHVISVSYPGLGVIIYDCTRVSTSGSIRRQLLLAHRTEIYARNRGKRVYDTRRTVTWECYALALNGFHERVLRSSRYPLNRNLIFAGKVPFSYGSHISHIRGARTLPRRACTRSGQPHPLSKSLPMHRGRAVNLRVACALAVIRIVLHV